MNKKILNFSERKTLIECMNNLHYKDYGCFNSEVIEVKKFWCALYKVFGIFTLGGIFKFITLNSPFIEKDEMGRIEDCERLSIKFLNYLTRNRLLKNE